MYIKANIDDCALIINDFLPNKLFEKIKNYNYEHDSSSYSYWSKGLYSDKNNFTTMKKVNVQQNIAVVKNGKIESEEDIFKEFLEILINCPFIPFQINSQIRISYYEYEKFSGINWHDDGQHTLNYSFYIHDNWDKDWGGETLIDTGRGLPLASYPIPNTLLAIKNNILHKVCPVTGPKKRKVLQVRGVFYE